MPISAVSQLREAYCCYKSQKQFPAGNAGKLSAMKVNGLYTISFLHGCPMDKNNPHVVS
jgi:uncharacterized protein (DUF3820 family)